jgi:hypothetical protein
LLVCDHERRNARLDRLVYTVPRSFAPANRPVQRNAKIGTVLDWFSVPTSDRGLACLRPVCQTNFNGDSETLARLIEGLVNAILDTVDDREIGTVPLDQTTHNGRRQLLASPLSVAGDYNTHVQIVAANRWFYKSVAGTPFSIECFWSIS